MSGKAESSSQTDSITVEENHEDSAETEEAVNALIRQYRAALASADIDTIAKLYQTDKVETADTITATSRVITGYMNTKCYIRSGLDEGTKVVFIYDDLQIADVDVLVPNLSYVYVKKAADGSYYIDPGTYNEETLSYEYDRDITDYVDELSNDAQISALYTDVNTKFEQICQNNQKLSDFMKKLNVRQHCMVRPKAGRLSQTVRQKTSPVKAQTAQIHRQTVQTAQRHRQTVQRHRIKIPVQRLNQTVRLNIKRMCFGTSFCIIGFWGCSI